MVFDVSRTQTRCLVVARRTPSPRPRTTRRLPTRTRAPRKPLTRRARARSSSHRMAFASGPQGRLPAAFVFLWSRCLHFFLYLLIASVFWSRSEYFYRTVNDFVADLFHHFSSCCRRWRHVVWRRVTSTWRPSEFFSLNVFVLDWTSLFLFLFLFEWYLSCNKTKKSYRKILTYSSFVHFAPN